MNRNLLLLLLGMSLILPSCDIWEDRASCPSVLALDCSLLEGKALKADIWIFKADGSLMLRSDITEHEFYKVQNYQVPKGEYRCYVWANLGEGTIATDMNTMKATLYKVAGKDADPLFYFHEDAVVDRDSVCVRVRPRKMFIDVIVTLKGLSTSDMARLDLVSPYGGFGFDGEGIRAESSVGGEGNGIVRLRMLRPSSLEGIRLDLLYLFSGRDPYDLRSDDLKDIYVTVDVTRLKTSIAINPWDKTPDVTIRY